MPWWSNKEIKQSKDDIALSAGLRVGSEAMDDTSTKVASHDCDGTLFEIRSVPTPDFLARDIQHEKLMDVDSPQPDLFSPGNKRPKEDDEVSTFVQAVKRRRSPPVESSNAKSITSSPPPDHPRMNDVDTDMALESADTRDDYAKEADTGHPSLRLLRDLETRAITVPQLIQEVKGIHAGLSMVEKKCIEIVDAQLKSPNKLTKEQWQALIALHRTLLNEHHDFFSASHHPVSKDRELRELATRHAMWRHSIHAFLELLRHRLPDSHEHMVSFIYLSYSMVALLKETVPEFLETWIECLGDLARYRMAIEESDLRDREVWAITARAWYNQAADLSPNTGQVQHHLAVLARPHIVQQLFLYAKVLVATISFKNAEESILFLFNPLLDNNSRASTRHAQADSSFMCAGAVLSERRPPNDFLVLSGQFISSFQIHLATTGFKFNVQGPEYAGSLFATLMDFGNEDDKLWRMIVDHQQKMKQIYCERNNEELAEALKGRWRDRPFWPLDVH